MADALQPQPSGVTPDKAKKILAANIVNLGRKVLDGKTLSAFELDLLRQQADPNTPSESWVKNKVELSKILGVSRQHINKCLKRPGHPETRPDGRYDVEAWRNFLGLGEPGDDEISQASAKAKQILLQNEKLQFQISILKKEYVPAAQVEQWGGELGAAVRKVVTQGRKLAPAIVGLSVAEAEAMLREHEDEVLEQLHLLDDRIANLKPDVPDEPAS